MAITINGSGTVTGISVGGLPDGVITTDDLASTVPVAKAWVNFNGTGTVAIRGQYNVSSITDNNTGDYTVNFTTAMPDANYAFCTSAIRGTAGGNGNSVPGRNAVGTSITTSAFKVETVDSGFSNVDSESISVAIFR